MHQGRYVYLVEQMEKYDVSITMETARKWFKGETIPTQEKMVYLTRIMNVDLNWLSMGEVAASEAAARRHLKDEADSTVNIVYDLLLAAGARARFADGDDAKKHGVDLHVVIKGASYKFCVVTGEYVDKSSARFMQREAGEDVITLGVISEDDDFRFNIFDLSQATIAAGSDGWSAPMAVSDLEERRIRSFAQRI
ncbi:hypothetical protein CD928_05905 [Sphingopyxis sp. GW247-27LB]|nr:hypothetical protein CD928_05905 [Sphingopyxis sp. GW247-27LB]